MIIITISKGNAVGVMSGGDDGNAQVAQKEDCCLRCSNSIVKALENLFCQIGRGIAKYPLPTIAISLTITLLFLIGLKDRYDENRQEKLWISEDSDSIVNGAWYSKNYPPEMRVCSLIVEAGNILTPSKLSELCTIDDKVKAINVNSSDNKQVNWTNTCFSTSGNGQCNPWTILQVWNNNCTHVRTLTQLQILDGIDMFVKNSPDKRGVGHLLGGISMDNQKKITGAKAAKMTYMLKNQLVFKRDEGRKVDTSGTAFEEEFGKIMETTKFNGDMIVYSTDTSRRNDASETIGGDIKLLGVSIALAAAYLVVMLGTLSRINHKVWLAVCGILCIGLSMGFTYGFCSACGLFVTPVHNILPFLLLGIGIDDVFVIVQNWELSGGGEDKSLSISDFLGRVMQHAGVSILVTSVTDICAFLIGATTILPALRSFCVYSGMGIIAVFTLTCTFFVAWLSLDTRRKNDRRDACCCCIKLADDWQPMPCSQKGYFEIIMGKYANMILSTPGRICVFIITAGILAGGAYGLSELKQEFDQDRFLPPDAMLLKYKAVDTKLFPEGIRPAIYVGKVDYFRENTKLDELYTKLNSDKYKKYIVPSSVDSWYQSFKLWLANATYPANEQIFYSNLTSFLNSQGRKYKADVKFDAKDNKIKASRIFFTHTKMESSKDKVAGMDDAQELAKSVKFDDFTPFSYTRFYAGYETNKIISWELIRNLILAGAIILIITLLLLANILVCILVLICIVLSLVNCSGYMHFWGLTVDIVTTIQLIIAIGLTVDYSAHIAHAFMSSRKGSRVERVKEAVVNIGPAVFHGGFSTFLAFVALAGSKSYVFLSFFKLLFLVVIFGLFHGLVFLPVLLSLVGPRAYGSVDIEPEKQNIEAASSEGNQQQEMNERVNSYDNDVSTINS